MRLLLDFIRCDEREKAFMSKEKDVYLCRCHWQCIYNLDERKRERAHSLHFLACAKRPIHFTANHQVSCSHTIKLCQSNESHRRKKEKKMLKELIRHFDVTSMECCNGMRENDGIVKSRGIRSAKFNWHLIWLTVDGRKTSYKDKVPKKKQKEWRSDNSDRNSK